MNGSPRPLRLSVLDIGPIRSGQSSAQAFSAMLALAQCADRLGYHRYWLAEHHNVPATVASVMPVFAQVVASRTRTIRIGGNVLLPHYPSFLVAESAAIMEACFPGRVDLALGGAAGADYITSAMLRGMRQGEDYVREVQALEAMLNPEGVQLNQQQGERRYVLKATPKADAAPTLWIWGTSRAQAVMAGQMGLPFMYCYHIMGRSDMDVVRVYRGSFVPSPNLSEPEALASVIVVIGKNAIEAEAMAIPHLHTMVAFRDGSLDQAQPLIGQESSLPPMTEQGKTTEAMFRKSWIIGTAHSAAGQISALALELGVDEIMINPVAAAYSTDPFDRAPNREFALRTLRDALLAQAGHQPNGAP